MERLQGPHNGLHHLGPAANTVRRQWRNANGVFGSRVVFADDAEDDQPSGEQRAEGNELAAFGLKKIEKVARFHGWPLGERSGCTLGVLVTVTTGGGGDRRFTSTVNWFFKERLFRPPSGVPVTAK